MGFNGSGKSTILKLVARIYDVTEGTIWINGRDIRDLKLDDLRRSMAVLFQDYTRGEHRPIYGIRPYTSSRHTVTGIPVPISVYWSHKVSTVRDGVYMAIYGTFTGLKPVWYLPCTMHVS